MATNRDSAADGAAYRPALFEQAQMFADWNPRTAPATGPDSLDLPATDDFSLTPWHVCPDRTNRINLSAWMASRHQRIYGFVAAIDECNPELADNTTTAYRFEVITRICFLPDGQPNRDQDRLSWMYVRVLAYSSNALICGQTGIALGSFVTGVLTANYNGRGRATLDAWEIVTDFSAWRMVSPETIPDYSCYDWAEWVTE